MKIPNQIVVALFIVFAVVGLIALPFEQYLWRYVHLVVVLLIGIVLYAGGGFGAGDAKFAAAAAPFVHLGDMTFMMALLAATLLAAVVTHRAAKYAGLTKFTPHWKSWTHPKFPVGMGLGGALAVYLGLGAFYGV